MNLFSRGVKNAFRNKLRFGAVVLILAIGIGLALSMLVANQAVKDRISSLKSEMGITLTINPAGSRGFEGGGEPLTTSDLKTIVNVDHVASASATLNLRLRNAASSTSQNSMAGPGGAQSGGTTSLESAIDAGTLGNRNLTSVESGTTDTARPAFSLPISAVGVSGNLNASGETIKITSGRSFTNDDSGKNVAIVGSSLASKNNLSVGSTFTAYDATITVVGIYNQGNEFDNGGLFVPLVTAQTISAQKDEISTILVQVDSIDNVENTSKALISKLGEDKIDVTSSAENVETAIESLQSVQKISIIGFIAALISAGVIIFMIMLVIVRERRREIGVLKAIGASNKTVMGQFMVESMVLILCGALAGIALAFAASTPIANALVSSNTSDSSAITTLQSGRGGMNVGGLVRSSGARPGSPQLGNVTSTKDLVGSVTTTIGASTLLIGLLSAFVIAIIGSTIPAWLTAKVRPSEVMRGE